MFCQNCGNEIQESDNFCPYCGYNQKVTMASGKNDDKKQEETQAFYSENRQESAQEVKQEVKHGNPSFLRKIGYIMLVIGVICILAFITAPSHRSEAAPVGVVLLIIGTFITFFRKKQ